MSDVTILHAFADRRFRTGRTKNGRSYIVGAPARTCCLLNITYERSVSRGTRKRGVRTNRMAMSPDIPQRTVLDERGGELTQRKGCAHSVARMLSRAEHEISWHSGASSLLVGFGRNRLRSVLCTVMVCRFKSQMSVQEGEESGGVSRQGLKVQGRGRNAKEMTYRFKQTASDSQVTCADNMESRAPRTRARRHGPWRQKT